MSKRKSPDDTLVPLPKIRRRTAQPQRANIQDVVDWHKNQPLPNPSESEQPKIAKALAVVHRTLAKEKEPFITNILDLTRVPPRTLSSYTPKYSLNPLVSTSKAARQHAYEMNAPQLQHSHMSTFDLAPIPPDQPHLVRAGSNTKTVIRDQYRTLLGTESREEQTATLQWHPGFVRKDGRYVPGFAHKPQHKRELHRNQYDKYADQFIGETLYEDHVNRTRHMGVSAVDYDEDNSTHVLRKRMSENRGY